MSPGTPPGGSGSGEGSVLEVTDPGPGMTPHDAKKDFDRFWRAEASRTRPGSGLGLNRGRHRRRIRRRRHAGFGPSAWHSSPRGAAFDTGSLTEPDRSSSQQVRDQCVGDCQTDLPR
ncbi:MAG: sensor histidine kinase [Acidimicrobiales bacterium]